MMAGQRLSRLGKLVHESYRVAARGSERYLTDAVRRALVSDAALSVMLARYEVEAERPAHTNPNEYVDAVREVWAYLEL